VCRFQRGTVSSGEFRDYFCEYVATNGTSVHVERVEALDWDQLFHAPGLPKHTPDFSTALGASAASLAARWIVADDATIASSADFVKADVQVGKCLFA
jgi:hypothetical protein